MECQLYLGLALCVESVETERNYALKRGGAIDAWTSRHSPGVVTAVRAGPVHLQRGVTVAHVHADARAVAELRQPGSRKGLQPRGRPAQVQAVADVQQIADRAVLQPVPVRDAGGAALTGACCLEAHRAGAFAQAAVGGVEGRGRDSHLDWQHCTRVQQPSKWSALPHCMDGRQSCHPELERLFGLTADSLLDAPTPVPAPGERRTSLQAAHDVRQVALVGPELDGVIVRPRRGGAERCEQSERQSLCCRLCVYWRSWLSGSAAILPAVIIRGSSPRCHSTGHDVDDQSCRLGAMQTS